MRFRDFKIEKKLRQSYLNLTQYLLTNKVKLNWTEYNFTADKNRNVILWLYTWCNNCTLSSNVVIMTRKEDIGSSRSNAEYRDEGLRYKYPRVHMMIMTTLISHELTIQGRSFSRKCRTSLKKMKRAFLNLPKEFSVARAINPDWETYTDLLGWKWLNLSDSFKGVTS